MYGCAPDMGMQVTSIAELLPNIIDLFLTLIPIIIIGAVVGGLIGLVSYLKDKWNKKAQN
jgi:uncharacterized membrane-anchored protein